MSRVSHHQAVGSVPETLCKRQIRTRPPALFFLDPEMQGSACIGPSIVTIVQIVQSAPVARNGANPPLVSAELKGLCRRELRTSYALDRRWRHDGTAVSRSNIQGVGRPIPRFHQ